MRLPITLLAAGILTLSASVASAAGTRQATAVTGAHVVERPAAGAPWTPLVGGHVHPGWQLNCPEGCAIAMPSGLVRLDETTTVRDLQASFVERDGGQLDPVAASLEILEGGASVEVSPAAQPVLLQSTDGAQLVLSHGRSGRVVSRFGRHSFAAMEGDAELRAPGQHWSTLSAGSVLATRAGAIGAARALAPAPTWAPLKPDTSFAVVDDRGNVIAGAEWASDPTAVAYRFEIARDAQFTRIVRQGETQYCSLSEKLPIGNYFVRIRAVDAAALETPASKPRALRIVASAPGA
jgi:hypothetical protein